MSRIGYHFVNQKKCTLGALETFHQSLTNCLTKESQHFSCMMVSVSDCLLEYVNRWSREREIFLWKRQKRPKGETEFVRVCPACLGSGSRAAATPHKERGRRLIYTLSETDSNPPPKKKPKGVFRSFSAPASREMGLFFHSSIHLPFALPFFPNKQAVCQCAPSVRQVKRVGIWTSETGEIGYRMENIDGEGKLSIFQMTRHARPASL